MYDDFKYIPGYENDYKINSNGIIYSYKTEKYLKIQTRKNGKKKITLNKNGYSKNYFVDNLINITFKKDEEEK